MRNKSTLSFLLSVAFISTFASCSLTKDLRHKAKAQRFIERAERLDPSAFDREVIIKDSTVVFVDTVIQVETKIDTTLTLAPVDTFILYDTITSTTVRIVRDIDTFRLWVDRPTDTLFLTDTVIIPTVTNVTTIKQTKVYGWLLTYWRLLVVILFIIAGVTAIIRFYKPK